MAHVKKQEREILSDFDMQFKEVRNKLNDQLKSLDNRQESEQKLIEDFQEYCKLRAEVEIDYGKKLEKIYDNFTRRQSSHKIQRDYTGDHGVPSPLKCWNLLLDNTRSQSKQHQSMGSLYSNNFANNLAHIREGLDNVHRKSREMMIGVHDNLTRELNELYSAIKSYHNAHRDFAEAEQKKNQSEAEIKRLEDKNKKVDKKLEKQREKLYNRYYQAELKTAKARNDYITIVGAVNSSLQKYFNEDVTSIIDCLDLGYIRLIRRNLSGQQSAEHQIHKMKGDELQRMELAIRNMHSQTDKELFCDANKNCFTIPDKFDFQAHPGDQVHEMIAPPAFIGDMEELYERLNNKIEELQLKVDENHKSLREVNRGWEDDNSNPLEDDVVNHFKNLRQIVSSPSVASSLNRVPSVRRTVKNLQQETEFYYLSKYKEYLEKSNHLTRTKSKRDLLRTSLGFDKLGADDKTSLCKRAAIIRRGKKGDVRTLRRRPVSLVTAKLFGGELIAYVKASGRDIPLVVERCVEYITLYGLSHQGIFRMPGATQDVDNYQEAFEKGRDVLYELGPTGDINLVASLLKKYFRELPEPIFPIAMFDDFIDCTRSSQGQDRIPDLAKLVEQLQRPIMVVMRYLFQFLKVLSQHHEETYMDSRNLATCLGPTLMWGPDELASFEFTSNVNQVIETMILFQEDIFPKAEGSETEYSFISITEGNDVALDDIEEEKSGLRIIQVRSNMSTKDVDISATANGDYERQTPEQLSFKKGDVVTLIKQVEGSMWEASIGDDKGLVPDSFMDYARKGTKEEPPLSPVVKETPSNTPDLLVGTQGGLATPGSEPSLSPTARNRLSEPLPLIVPGPNTQMEEPNSSQFNRNFVDGSGSPYSQRKRPNSAHGLERNQRPSSLQLPKDEDGGTKRDASPLRAMTVRRPTPEPRKPPPDTAPKPRKKKPPVSRPNPNKVNSRTSSTTL